MSTYTAEMAYAAAHKGAALLDTRCEGWQLLIDTDRLDLASSQSCILGQTAHCVTTGTTESNTLTSYEEAVSHLFRTRTAYLANAQAEKHGFVTPDAYASDTDPDYDGFDAVQAEENTRWEMLTIAWREEIRRRIEQ